MTTRQNRLRKQLSFALYSAANRMVRMHRPLLEPLGLTFSQYLVILELLDSAPVPVGELGNRLGMDTSTITPLVKRIELAGLVTRTRDVNDERRVMVDLTVAGVPLNRTFVVSQIRSSRSAGLPRTMSSACMRTSMNLGIRQLNNCYLPSWKIVEGLGDRLMSGFGRTRPFGSA
jgi:hypothetical protein